MALDKRTGMTLPPGILSPTTQRELSPPADEGQGTETVASAETPGGKSTTPKLRRKRTAVASEKVEGRRLYLSEGVHFRLRMLAYQRGQKLSEVAEDVLDKALPKYDVSRTG